MNQKIIISIVVTLIVLGGGVVYVLSQGKTSGDETGQIGTSVTPSDEDTPGTSGAPTATESASDVTIIFNDDGFYTASYSVKVGSTVTVKNESNRNVQFSSDDHPAHLKNPEMNLEELAPGESGRFTPTTKGTYGFHDHLNDHFGGTLAVK